MKYLPLRDFDSVTNALNFSTPDCHVIGGCDVYTTKAAGGDKKLYKNIENSLESQYESLVRLSASLSPPYRSAGSDDGKGGSEKDGHRKKLSRTAELPEIDLSRASPFGPLSQISARRTLAYLIATLNASHPDYEFSHLLRPTDFRKERSLRAIMQTVDSTLQNLRPKPSQLHLAPPVMSRSAPVVANSTGNEVWSPMRMWSMIDKEMGLRSCEKYRYVPDDDPFDGEDGGGSVWSYHYFFFNKEKKRVCYLHLRGLSVISHSPVHAPTYLHRPKLVQRKVSSVSVGDGAGKRASYWLGDRVLPDDIDTTSYADDDDDDEIVIAEPDDDEVEVPQLSLDDIRSDLAEGYYSYDAEDDGMDDGWRPLDSRRYVRGGSEDMWEVMDL